MVIRITRNYYYRNYNRNNYNRKRYNDLPGAADYIKGKTFDVNYRCPKCHKKTLKCHYLYTYDRKYFKPVTYCTKKGCRYQFVGNLRKKV